jgi:hypothetical protein
MFEMAYNLVLYKNGAKLTHMFHLKYSILRNEVRYCKPLRLLVSTNAFWLRCPSASVQCLSSLKTTRAE